MTDLSQRKRNYQAEVHFTLGAVIQGITVAALGNEIADSLRMSSVSELGWVFVTAFQSLLLCIIFWYTFIDNYFFGFRAINLTARSHFLFAVLYLILGLLQLLAIRFIDEPRTWMTFFVLLFVTTLSGTKLASWFTTISDPEVRQALDYDPGSKTFVASFVAVVICLGLWYFVPGLDTPTFKVFALTLSGICLLLFTLYYMRLVDRHLDAGDRT
jgi:hypothetical protein